MKETTQSEKSTCKVYYTFLLHSVLTDHDDAGDVTTFVHHSSLKSAFRATKKKLKEPCGIVMNYKEDVFFVINRETHTISKITSSGTQIPQAFVTLMILTYHQGDVSVFAGSGLQGSNDGTGINASFFQPSWIAIDQQTGTLFVSDTGNNMIRSITHKGEYRTLSILFNFAKCYSLGDVTTLSVHEKGKVTKFNYPQGICYNAANKSLIVCERDSSRLRRLQLNGMYISSSSRSHHHRYLDSHVNRNAGEVSTMCEVDQPVGIALTASGTILISSYPDHIYKVTPKGTFPSPFLLPSLSSISFPFCSSLHFRT